MEKKGPQGLILSHSSHVNYLINHFDTSYCLPSHHFFLIESLLISLPSEFSAFLSSKEKRNLMERLFILEEENLTER